MKIKIINPNTTWSMTKSVEEISCKYARKDTIIEAVSPKTGPDSIECYVDEYLAVPGVIEEILKGEKDGVDAYVIACFGDPGLQAAREVTKKPVLGIAQSAMLLSSMISPYFSIVSVLDRSRKVTEDLVKSYGMESICKSIRTTGMSVLEFGENPQKGLEAIEKQCRIAIESDGAECILLGCAGFVDFVDELNKKLGVTVLDGVVPAIKFAEAMVDMRIYTSKFNTWTYPENKNIAGFEYLNLFNNLNSK